MSSRNADVNLIIRAKTEGEKAISSLADAVDHLINGAGAGSKEFEQFGRTLGALDKAASGLISAQEKVSSSATKQASAIHQAAAGIAEQQDRVETLRRGLTILAAEADKAFVGPKRDGLADLIRTAKSEMADAEGQLRRYTAAYDRNLAGLQGSRSGLLDLRRATADTTDAQNAAAAAVELNTQALSRQSAEARRAAAAQSFFNAKGGPSGSAAIDNGAGFGALLENFRQLEAEAKTVRAALDPLGAAVEQYHRRIENLRGAALNGIIGSDDAIARERQLHIELQQTLDRIGHVTDAEQDRVRKGVDGLRQLSRAEQALGNRLGDRAINVDQALERSTGAGKLPATSQGATFSALEARALEEEAVATERAAQAKREAAHAYDLFEAKVRDGAKAMREADDAAARDLATIERLQAVIDPLGTVQRRLNAELETYRKLAAAGKISTEDLARAESHFADEAEKARLALERGSGKATVGLFGLKPYELQNLSYQINDVFTQLASGTSITQTLGQQGGQILQIFPRITNAIVGAFTNPAFLGAASVFIGISLAMKRAADDAERLRGATALLNSRADGAGYDPKTISAQEKQFERIGATADEARGAIRAFLDQSVAPDKLNLFGKAAEATAEALGQKLPEAARSVAEAFTGGYDAIAKFDEQLNFLTADQREHIRTLFDEGKGQQARTEALNIYVAKQQELADKSRGQWSSAARELTLAWSSFMDLLAKSAVIQGFTEALGNLAGAARVALRDLNNMGDTAGTLQQVAETRAQIAALNAQIAKTPDDGTAYSKAKRLRAELGDRERALVVLVQRYNDLAKAAGQAQLAADGSQPGANAKAAGDTISNSANSTAAKQRNDELRRISFEDELQRLRDAGQSRLLTKAEQARRAELAGQEAARSVADAVVAAAEKRRAAAKETAAIERESDARMKAAQAERERSIRSYLNAIVAAEGGTGRNKAGSSAVGAGQFTRGTFLSLYKKINPGTGLDDNQIADLRKDSQTALRVLEVFTRDNARLIERAGKEVNAANLYLIHFLGSGTGGAALRANPNTPIDRIINRVDPNAAAVKSQNAAYLRTERGKGRYRTVGELQNFLGSRVGDNPGSRAQTQIVADEANLIEDARQKQDAFNTAVRHGVEDRERNLEALKAEAGLYGTALMAEQRRQAVAKAELELRQKTEDANKNLQPGQAPVVVSQEQVDREKEMAGALFDQQHAREALNAQLADAGRPIDDLTAQRDLLRDQAEYLRSIGESRAADEVDAQFLAVGAKIRDAYDTLIAFYQALSPEQRVELGIINEAQLDNIIEKLRQAKQQTQEWGKIGGIESKQVAQFFVGAATNAFNSFIQRVESGSNVFKALGQSVREFAANFISSIAQALVQLLAFAAAVQVLRALGVPIPAGVGGGQTGIGVGQNHIGGLAGASAGGVRRTVDANIFVGAARYHRGGIAGFAPDEVPAVLRKNEEVLTESDPRHRFNGGLAANDTGAEPSTKIVNLLDREDMAQHFMSSKTGERVILNVIRKNSRSIKASLD